MNRKDQLYLISAEYETTVLVAMDADCTEWLFE